MDKWLKQSQEQSEIGFERLLDKIIDMPADQLAHTLDVPLELASWIQETLMDVAKDPNTKDVLALLEDDYRERMLE